MLIININLSAVIPSDDAYNHKQNVESLLYINNLHVLTAYSLFTLSKQFLKTVINFVTEKLRVRTIYCTIL